MMPGWSPTRKLAGRGELVRKESWLEKTNAENSASRNRLHYVHGRPSAAVRNHQLPTDFSDEGFLAREVGLHRLRFIEVSSANSSQ
jgi:hypothetical protein